MILVDSSDSDSESDVEPDSSNGNYMPDSGNRNDVSSDEYDDTDNTNGVQQESAIACGGRGRGNGRRGGTVIGRRGHGGAGEQGGSEQEGSVVVCGDRVEVEAGEVVQ